MSNKPFNLEAALAGEPVVLRNGCKGFIKFRKPSYCDFSPSSELGGYWINNKNIAITENWKIDGVHYDDSNIYIVGMWQEPRPRVTLDLPCSLKEPQEGVWHNEMIDLIRNIEQWAIERNLIEGSTPQKQMLKLIEEFGELCGGVAKNKPEVIKDSIGDCFVVLVILKRQLGITGSDYDFATLTEKFTMPSRFTVNLACLDFGVHYGELARCIGLVDSFGIGIYPSNIAFNLIRCFGSLLAIVCTQNLKIEECVQHAYNQIKDRKGRMIDGVWVKQEDLQNE